MSMGRVKALARAFRMVASVRRRHGSHQGSGASRSRPEQALVRVGVQIRADVDERQRRHQAGPLLGQGRGHAAAGRDARWPSPGPRRAGPVRRRPGGPGQRCWYPPAGLDDLPWPARSARITRQAPASCGITGSHQAVEAPRPWISSTAGAPRLAVLHHVHHAIVKPHQPVAGTRIAGHVLCHCAASFICMFGLRQQADSEYGGRRRVSTVASRALSPGDRSCPCQAARRVDRCWVAVPTGGVSTVS